MRRDYTQIAKNTSSLCQACLSSLRKQALHLQTGAWVKLLRAFSKTVSELLK